MVWTLKKCILVVGVVDIVSALTWTDWDRRQVCHPLDYRTPANEQELISVITGARAAGKSLKVVGAGHSFSSIALTSGVMVSLDKMDKILRVDGTLVTVQAGIRLHDINAQLEEHNLSLENLGATCEQSLAGAAATGTHGTGRLTGNMAKRIEALRIVAANGSVIEASGTQNKELFDAARVGLGSLGVISELSVRTLPLFRMRLTTIEMPLDELLKQLPVLMPKYERLQWYWLPPNEQSATLLLREVTEEPISPSGGCWDGELSGHHLTEPASFFGKSSSDLKNVTKTCVDVSYKAMCGSRSHYHARNLYTEMEMFVPVAEIEAAIAEFREFQASVLPQHNSSVSLFTGVRYVAADDMLLSQTSGRETAVISMIVMGPSKEETGDPTEFARYAGELERLCAQKFAGRPHWGKMNWATHSTLVPNYDPESWSRFLTMRAQMDPTGMFLNEYLRVRLGVTQPKSPWDHYNQEHSTIIF